MNDRLPIPSLTARLMPNNSIFIWSIYDGGDGIPDELALFLKVGETFGGRTYEEWFSVAIGTGAVDPDWLDV